MSSLSSSSTMDSLPPSYHPDRPPQPLPESEITTALEPEPVAPAAAIAQQPQSPAPASPLAAPAPAPASPPVTPPAIQLQGKEDPRRWSLSRKWITTGIISCMGFIAPLGSSIIVPGAMFVDQNFHLSSRTLSLLPVSLYVAAQGLAPLTLAPLSEIYGRQPVYLASCIVFVLFNIGSALSPNVAALFVLRFIAGAAGSAGPSLGAGSIGDMFAPVDRGRAQSLYALGPLMGPVVGNIIGGFIVKRTHDWRWLLWTLTILSAVCAVLVAVSLRETFAPAILRAKVKRLAKERSTQEDASSPPSGASLVPTVDTRKTFQNALSRPFRLLFTNPICAIFSCFLGYTYGIIFLFLTQHPLLFQKREGPDAPRADRLPTYGWDVGTAGLSYLGLGAGFLMSALLNVLFQDAIYQRLASSEGKLGLFLFKSPHEIQRMMTARKEPAEGDDSSDIATAKAQVIVEQPPAAKLANEKPAVNGTAADAVVAQALVRRIPLKKGRPEYRLPLCALGMLILPAGLFCFGWSAQGRTHWMLPLVGSFLTGMGTILCFQTILVYLVDAFQPYSASATACAVLVRSILAAAFPLFAQKLYERLGYGWGSSILAFVSIAAIPVPIILFYHGESLRQRWKFNG